MSDFSKIEKLVKSGEIDKATQAISSISEDPSNDVEKRSLARLCKKVNLNGRALMLLEKIERPNYEDFTEKGINLFFLNQFLEAREVLKTSLLLKETSVAYYVLAFALSEGKPIYQLDKELRSDIVKVLQKATRLEKCGPDTFLLLDDYLEAFNGFAEDKEGQREENLNDAISRHPENRSIRIRLGSFYSISQRNPKKAIEVLSPLFEEGNDSHALWIAFEAAKNLNDFAQALSFVQRINPVHGDNSSIFKVRGDLQLALGNFDEAIECYNREIMAKSEGHKKIIGLFSRAYANLKKGDIQQAAKDAENAAQMCFDTNKCDFGGPAYIDVNEGWSDYYSIDESIVEVCKAFIHGTDISPIRKDSITFGQLCYLFSKYEWNDPEIDESDDYEGPNYWVQRAAQILSHPILSSELSDILASEGDLVGAIDHHMKYCIWKFNLSGQSEETLQRVGNFYVGSDFSPTKTESRNIHKLLQGYFEQHKNDKKLNQLFVSVYESVWNKVLRKAEMFKEMFDITASLTSFSTDSSVWFDFAYSASRSGKKEVAEEGYRRCIELNPESTSACHNLSILVQEKNLKEAVELSRLAFEKAPTDKLFKERYDSFRPILQFQKLADKTLKYPIEFDTLSVKDRLYLGAVLVSCLSEDQNTIGPVEAAKNRLAPGNSYETNILSHLWNRGILTVDPVASFGAININSEGKEVATLRKVSWILNVNSPSNMSKAKMLNQLVEPSLVDEENHEEAIELWKEMALEESLEYLQYKRATVELNADVSDKTREYFSDLLERYSTAQMYNIVWNSVKNAVMFQKEKRLSNAHAANLVSSGCKQYGDKAMAEGWSLKPYRRNYDLPQTVASQLLYNRLLVIGEAGFNCRPGSHPIGSGLNFIIPEENEVSG
jgi:tetratricopeptide (TPR) repeat protein